MVESTGSLADGRRDLARGARQILAGAMTRMAARVALVVLAAKLFGAESFGRLGETAAIVELSAAFATFGLNKTLLAELSGGDGDPARRSEALALTFVVAAAIAAILLAIWPFLFEGDAVTPFAIAGVPLIALTETALTITRSRRTVAWDTAVKTVVKPWSFLLLALLAFLLAGARANADALILAYLASLAIAALAAVAALRRMGLDDFVRPAVPGIAALARRSAPIAMSETGVMAFRRADIIILGLVAGPAATGIYYLAQQIGTVAEKARYLYEPMLAPILARSMSLADAGAHLRRLCRNVLWMQLPLLALAVLFGDKLLAWFGDSFATAGALTVLVIVLVGELVDGAFGLTELALVYRRPAWPPRTVLAALVIEVALVALLADRYGAAGAATGFAVAMIVLASMRLLLVRRLLGLRILSRQYALPLFAAAALIAYAAVTA